MQVLFNRLYKGGSNLDGGTLLQLRNLINRRNVSADTSNKFNASIDYFELVTKCHIISVTMHYFGMRSIEDTPTCNAFAIDGDPKQQWKRLQKAVREIVERFVFVQDFSEVVAKGSSKQEETRNPHSERISHEHSYAKVQNPSKTTEANRVLPENIRRCADCPNPSRNVTSSSPDKVLDYACSVLSDGLLLLELRDAIHEGDGERDLRCWRFMLLYFSYSGHKKYALEALYLQAAFSATANSRTAQELLQARFINVHGGPGRNIPTDLFMEHLNRTLKDHFHGLGANISENTIVQIAKSLKALIDITNNFDHTLKLHPESLHHTTKSSIKDRNLILSQLATSRVFDYIPGRFHFAFKNIKSHVSDCVNVAKLVKWIKEHTRNMANNIKLRNILHAA
ncbi:hypothetical protein SPONL_183 [uncultured Candidatus Thioglobus sp.]|nr:hypothetical protein SPONL_183 [uncultured Candidatus Thioglobus sp.]